MRSKLSFDPIYMVPTAWQVLKTWPAVSHPKIQFEIPRLEECGIISGGELTLLGKRFREEIDTQGCNFFTMRLAFDAIPIDELANRSRRVIEYVRLFQMDINDVEMRRYINQRLQPGYKPMMEAIILHDRDLVELLGQAEKAANWVALKIDELELVMTIGW